MTHTENSRLTMKIIQLLGIAGVAVLVASYLAARGQRREQEARDARERLHESIERERWESEGGANPSGPATSAIAPGTLTAH